LNICQSDSEVTQARVEMLYADQQTSDWGFSFFVSMDGLQCSNWTLMQVKKDSTMAKAVSIVFT